VIALARLRGIRRAVYQRHDDLAATAKVNRYLFAPDTARLEQVPD